jgi:peptide/nickel transport system permease protein
MPPAPSRLGTLAPADWKGRSVALAASCGPAACFPGDDVKMLGYLIRRLFFGAAVLIGTSLITFTMAFVVPADPAVTIAGAKADPQTLATIRHELGLDQPLHRQYLRYLDRAIHGDLGRSYIRREPVARLILSRFPATAVLALTAIALSLAIGIPMGAIAAAYSRRLPDNVLLVAALALVSMPVFWLGTMLLIAGGLYLRSFPLGGFGGWRSLVLPTLTLALGSAGYYSRILETNLSEALTQDYIRTARGKGLSRVGVMLKHAMANALLPLVTLAGLDLAGLLSGVVLTETVFNWPGIGRLAFEAIFNLDIPLIMGTVLFSAFLIVAANLAVDLIYAWLDPRIRLTETG